ncbi:hypothetical protein [Hymenobacter crusticola]|uniref:hypothetical protein n=1 Tax=Hymenobacter crusticola TaxID=1770526 RepID=UPI0015C4E7CE|nr:hypothetical protein [Hymenobacter crusticola]
MSFVDPTSGAPHQYRRPKGLRARSTRVVLASSFHDNQPDTADAMPADAHCATSGS